MKMNRRQGGRQPLRIKYTRKNPSKIWVLSKKTERENVERENVEKKWEKENIERENVERENVEKENDLIGTCQKW